MTITCLCGATILDQHGALPDKARFVPDESWDALWQTFEQDVLAPLSAEELDRVAAYRKAYVLFHEAARLLHQCSVCGRLYVDDPRGGLRCFVAADADVDRQVLRKSEG